MGMAALNMFTSGGKPRVAPYFRKRSNYRLAVVVSKKVHKSAVARNRIRRRIYEAFRLFEPDIAEPYDLVLTVFSDTAESEPIEKIQSQIKKQLQSSDVLVKRVVRQE
jgi:ribonuclease P protein component